MLEKDIERKLHKGVKALKHGALCLKFESPGFSGVPDRMILLPGEKVIFVETKKPGEKERARQEYVHGLFRDLGFEVYSTVDNKAYVEEILGRCKEVIGIEGFCTT
ncbi:MAG: VRR-NUC domain-containing protein [Clostridia bacterium]|nr:VRR-NUC domain-containing protein [Clostridia bacterium]